MKQDAQDYAATADVAIVGAGPVGLELAATLKRAGVEYLHFDAAQIGHTISWWPRDTHFFSTSERLAIAGIPIQVLGQERLTGEAYLAYLRAAIEQLDLEVRTYERVTDIQAQENGFDLSTQTLVGSSGTRSLSRTATSPWRELPRRPRAAGRTRSARLRAADIKCLWPRSRSTR